MNIRRRIAGVLSIIIILAMIMPLNVLADFDEEYIVEMTPEEVSAALLAKGINLDKDVSTCASIEKGYVDVTKESNYGRISVTYYTEASIVANEIGIKSLDFYESKSGGGWTTLVSDYKDYYGFKKVYSGGFYYTNPVSGRQYYAEGTNYAVLTTTTYNSYNISPTITY